ncbi:MAG: hypothetical protein OQK50_09825 [Deltaproteobacteria bacterium]|nr:hypothetical protein [Deltaproteobacteria bacterium]MCW9050614.1 hypothetical protein [Deltaproteobacteria bacterium]
MLLSNHNQLFDFWGARIGSGLLTNVHFDLSTREEMVSMPAHEQDA